MPLSDEDKRRLNTGGSHFADGSLKRIDKWMKILGLGIAVDWVRFFGIPLHVWRKDTL